jgi:hypothetical protein
VGEPPYEAAVIDRLREHPEVQDAAMYCAIFGGNPDEALNVDRRRWQLRKAAAHIVLDARRPPT